MLPTHEHSESLVPWYKQFWPWVLIALPLSSVIAGLSTLYIAVVNQDDLVIEKWSKDGKAIFSDNSRFQAAEQLGLRGEISVDSLTGEVFLQLRSNGVVSEKEPGFVYPDFLLLDIIHPTMASRDQNIRLSKVANHYYKGQLLHQVEASRSVFLSGSEKTWQIKFKFDSPSASFVQIVAEPSAADQ